MKKDTAIIISGIILSVFNFVLGTYGRGLILLTGVAGLIAIISLIYISSPMEDLNEDEDRVFVFEKKFLWVILCLVVFNIIGYYAVYYYVGGSPNDNRLLLSISTILGFASLPGFVLGLIISIFPYQKMDFSNRFNRSTILGLLIVHSFIAFIYSLGIIKFFVLK